MVRTLDGAYVPDGSVRKSGSRLRVTTRLIRADNGYVVWSETYDRPFNDILMVQDNIASEVTTALRASIEAQSDRPAGPLKQQHSAKPAPAPAKILSTGLACCLRVCARCCRI